MRAKPKAKTVLRRIACGIMALLLAFSPTAPYIGNIIALAGEAEHQIGEIIPFPIGEGYACIDSHELLGSHGGIYAGPDTGYPDLYNRVLPSENLSSDELATIFWAGLAFYGGNGWPDMQPVFESVQAAGLPITTMSMEDLKKVLHSQTTRNKYPWLAQAKANAETYLTAAGLIGGTGTIGGGTIPTILTNSYDVKHAYNMSSGSIDVGDPQFLDTVKIEYSVSGADGTWGNSPVNGYVSTISGSVLSLSGGTGSIYVKFDPANTGYSTGSGAYTSASEVYDKVLELYVCAICGGKHTSNPSPSKPEWHQRFINMHRADNPVTYYARYGSIPHEEGDVNFQCYYHEEDWTTHYNLKLGKYDHETGKGLEGVSFDVYERFDDKGKVSSEDGPEHLVETETSDSNSAYRDSPVTWNNFRKIGTVTTSGDGTTTFTKEHKYHYEKTFCDGHPAPEFVEVPEAVKEKDPKTGAEKGVTNQDEIDLAQSTNRDLADAWLAAVSDCEDCANSKNGIHFHWIMDDVDESEIQAISSSGGEEGETPSAGNTTSASGDEAFVASGCQDDCEAIYHKFTAMKYSYTFVETKARDGYALHDLHTDSIPIEIITTDSSENGAHSSFAGNYSKNINTTTGVLSLMMASLKKGLSLMFAPAADTATPSEAKYQEETEYKQPVISLQYEEPTIEVKTEEEEAETEALSEAVVPAEEPVIEIEAVSEELSKEDETEIVPEEESHEISFVSMMFRGLLITAYADELSVEELPVVEAAKENAEKADEETETPVEEESEPESAEESAAMPVLEGTTSLILMEEEEEAPGFLDKAGEFFFSFTKSAGDFFGLSLLGGGGGSSAFDDAYAEVFPSPTKSSDGDTVTTGSSGNYSHCNNADGEGNMWRVYDHRVEGQIHINKKDLDLANDITDYDAYGEANGDGTLEGAVYGLFAASDIVHPDGKTGVVYSENDLVAVATTDAEGNASFMVNTEAPHSRYNYATGQIEVYAAGPVNLYVSNTSIDDYSADGKYVRTYYDYQDQNGNCWIGRPLILGEYYVKELSRSEGYEVSVGMKSNAYTNYGQDLDAGVPVKTDSTATVTMKPYVDGQIEGKHVWHSDPVPGQADADEVYFRAESYKTGSDGFDLAFTNFPAGTKIYRFEEGTKTITQNIPTGNYIEQLVLDGLGNPIMVTAGDHEYMKYDGSGNPLYTNQTVNKAVSGIPARDNLPLDPAEVTAALEAAEDGMTETDVATYLTNLYTGAADEELFVKTKLERALRLNGKSTPYELGEYSTLTAGVYDVGIPGSPSVYGQPTAILSIAKSSTLTVGDMIATVADYYNTHGYYTFGGIHSIDDDGANWKVTVYAGANGTAAGFYTEIGSKGAIFARVPHDTTDPESTRYIYAVYTSDGSALSDGTPVFGSYTDFVSGTLVSATLVNEAESAGTGFDYSLQSRLVSVNEYYPAGTCPVYDAHGNVIYKTEWVAETTPTTLTVPAQAWTYLGMLGSGEPKVLKDVPGVYTDSFGAAHSDMLTTQEYRFLAVVPSTSSDMSVTLTAEDIDAMGADSGWNVGDRMGVAAYCVEVSHCAVKAYLDYDARTFGSADSYIMTQELTDPGQNYTWQDGTSIPGEGTTLQPLNVLERPIRQSIAVKKDIAMIGGHYQNNTYDYTEVVKETNFRFKTYLKSNLEGLYRDEAGNVVWVDKYGNPLTVVYEDGNADGKNDTFYFLSGVTKSDFPEKDLVDGSGALLKANVQKIYTKVTHNTDSMSVGLIPNNIWNAYITPQGGALSNVGIVKAFTSSARKGLAGEAAVTANASLYSYNGTNTDKEHSDKLNDSSNTGYTRILETVEKEYENGTSTTLVETEEYNYQKFFDAVEVANNDKWDDKTPTYSSYRPIGNKKNRSSDALEIAKRSDMVRQFAIDWYLEDEAAKLLTAAAGSAGTENAGKTLESYSAGLYDKALYQAILKAEKYLVPFFRYDLDTIYAVEFDSTANGGADGDYTTLSLDLDNTTEVYNTSAYLPYGDYILVEQQPKYVGPAEAAFNDFKNKHYETDAPKVVHIPSLYTGTGANDTADNYDTKYVYSSSMTNEAQASKGNYLIRFGEECHQGDALTSKHVIRANSYFGFFEVYKYGLDVDAINSNGTKTVTSAAGTYAYYGYSLIQEADDPSKDRYKTTHLGEDGAVIGTAAGGNDGTEYYITAAAANNTKTNNGTLHYDAETNRDRYHYASVSEDAGTADKVMFKNGATDENNRSGMSFHNNVKTMTGERTAYEGLYAPMLVPYTVTKTIDVNNYSAAGFVGYADSNIRNTFYGSRLRIEKLDAETHENILHDEAVFAIYKAERSTVTGEALFYTADTAITGSKEFVTAYCKKETVMPVDPADPSGTYQGTVLAGTPICHEADRVVLGDRYGNQISKFESFSTKQEVLAKTEAGNTVPGEYILQDVGYIELPQPLGAGTYVLLEEEAPSGYVRSKPIAVEIYSDEVTYYRDGNKDDRVVAAIFEKATNDEMTDNGNKPQDSVDVATVYVENSPIKLEVSKVKESSVSSAYTTADKTVSYRYSGRKDGKLLDILADESLIPAYSEAGKYLGWGYRKGTLEYLAALKEAYDTDGDPLTKVEIVYTGTVFAGYGYVTRPLLTGDDANAYVEGSTLTMYDALQLRRNTAYDFGKSDYAFSFPDGSGTNHALIIERDSNSNVTRMYVEKGYAGTTTEFVPETDSLGVPVTVSYQTGYDKTGVPIYTSGNVWKAQTVERKNTDILFYNLDSMDVIQKISIEGTTKTFGYDADHKLVDVARLMIDYYNFDKTDSEYSIYGYRGGVKYLEFVGGDLTALSYSATNKTFTVDPATKVYHIDGDGNRDALVDPYTGMAYVLESGKYLVWAVDVVKDAYGNVIGRDKVTTSRVATIGENVATDMDAATTVTRADDPAGTAVSGTAGTFEHTESGSVTGSWASAGTGESNQETTFKTNEAGNSMHGEALVADNNGTFEKRYDPVYDSYGNVLYYQRNNETYDKGTDLYDRDNDFVRYTESDELDALNGNAYRVNTDAELYDADHMAEDPATKALYHRSGEGYILQNTWVTGDYTPNDPFATERTDGQADLLKRIPYGTYIIEEVAAPEGYLKSEPVGITVNETTVLQKTDVIDRTTKLEIAKIDGTKKYELSVYNESNGGISEGTVKAGTAVYSGELVAGAELALYKAKKVYTADYEHYPNGYYLVKDETTPLMYKGSEWTVSNPVMQEARWTTSGTEPIYLEGIPEGFYLLCELTVPEGFLKMEDVEVEIGTSREVLAVTAHDDHTRVEVEKLYEDTGTSTLKQLRGASFELYEADLDGSGNVQYDADGNPKYKGTALASWTSSEESEWINFTAAFKAAYAANGTATTTVGWTWMDGTHTASVTGVEQLDASLGGGLSANYPTSARMTLTDELGRAHVIEVYGQTAGTKNFTYDFEFDVKKHAGINGYAVSYTTNGGMRRFEYLPAGAKYVAVEKAAPAGFAKADPVLIEVKDRSDVSRYHVVDRERQMIISKRLEGVDEEAVGAGLALYRAEGGALVMDAAHLVDAWASGTEGSYTSDDMIHGRVPAGYHIGDLRAHAIKGIPTGKYFLVETVTPEYYRQIDPVEIDYTDATEVKFVRAINEPVKGKFTLTKTETDGTPLSGATFVVRRYSKTDLQIPVFESTYTMTGSVLVLSDLPVGETDAKGNITPYKYSVKEILPPAGFMLNTTTYSWSFKPDKGGDSYKMSDVAEFALTVKNKETSFTFSKKNFDSLGSDDTDAAFTNGANLGIYELTGTDLDGNPLYNSASPLALFTATTTLKEFTLSRKLVAGKSYVLTELSAPNGSSVMQPVMFTVSADGRKIEAVSNRSTRLGFNFITAEAGNPDADSVLSASVHGRYVTVVTYKVTDLSGTLMETFPGGMVHVFDRATGYDDAKSYTITEEATYSDGSVVVTDTCSKFFVFGTDGKWTFETRGVASVTERLSFADGKDVGSFVASSTLVDKDILNNVLPEYPRVAMSQSGKTPGEPLKRDYAIINEVTVLNPTHAKGNAVVTIEFDADTTVIDEGTGVMSAGKLTFTVPDLAGYTEETLQFLTKNTGDATKVKVTVTLNGKTYQTEKTVPTVKAGTVTLHNELTGSSKEIYADEESSYRIRMFYRPTGDELTGTYAYTGSRSGNLKSGDTVTLKGNEWIRVGSGIYEDVDYQIERIADGLTFTAIGKTGNFTDTKGAGVLFTRAKANTAETTYFRPGESYDLIEETRFTDGSMLTTSRLRMTIDADGRVGNVTAFDRDTKVVISKLDPDGNFVPGCELEIYDNSDTLVDTINTGLSSENLTAQLLSEGRYRLHEKTPAAGYAYSGDIRFNVTGDGTNRVVMVDKTTHVSFSKQDYSDSHEIPGCEMKLYRGTVLIEEWISTGYPHEIIGKLIAGETYTLHEEKPADGYSFSADVTFTVSLDGTVDHVTMKDKKTSVEVKKAEFGKEDLLAGAVLQILDATTETVVHEWTSEKDVAHKVEGILLADHDYILHEKTAPIGYQLAEDIPFRTATDGTVLEIRMDDKKQAIIPDPPLKEYYVTVTKVGEDGKPLSGATIKVTSGGTEKEVELDATGTVFKFRIEKGEEIEVSEITPPKAYKAVTKSYHISVDSLYKPTLTDGDEFFRGDGEDEYNFILTDTKKKGRLLAKFQAGYFDGEGEFMRFHKGSKYSGGGMRSPKTGDDSQPALAWAVLITSALAAGYLIITGRKRKGQKK